HMNICNFLPYGDGGTDEFPAKRFNPLQAVLFRLIPLDEERKYLIAASHIQQFPADGFPVCHALHFDRAMDSKTACQNALRQSFDIIRTYSIADKTFFVTQ